MKPPFPRTFYVANAIELFERMAFYGMFIGASLYLTNVVGFGDVAVGTLLAGFRFVTSFSPIACGAIADKITFRASLVVAFTLYAVGYALMFLFPTKELAVVALGCLGFGGGFMKPVIAGTVVRTSPEGRQTEGFAIFYRMINAGSVVGKTTAWRLRIAIGLRFTLLNSIVASFAALALALFAYKEPERGAATSVPLGETMRGYKDALKNLRFSIFLVLFAGFYFMSDQFYVTFPKYVTRHIDKDAPLEIITLVNPALIAIGQGLVTKALARVHPVTTMILGIMVGAMSMLAMGAAPGLAGACLSGALFAVAEMTCSPRFYDYIASFAPPGKAGMYMGLAFVPQAIGFTIGGQVSGFMIAKYLPQEGPRAPLSVWATYAAIGVACAAAMLVYRLATRAAKA